MANLSATMKNFCGLEQLAEGHTVVHRLHPLAKLAITLVYVIAVISFPIHMLSGLVPLAIYPMVGMALSETPWKPLLRRMALAGPFVVITGLSNLLLDRQLWFYLGGIPVTGGLLSCLSILLKAFLTISAVLLLIATTSMTDLANQLVQLHVPRVLCLQLMLTYRYISVLLAEASQMYTAYQLRSGGGRGIRMGDMGCFLGQLLLRSYDRADRVYCAMKCRGYDGSYRTGSLPCFTVRDGAAATLLCAGILLLRLINLSMLLGRLF